MGPIVGNNVINMVALVPNIVVQPDSAAQVQDITLMVIVPLEWKKLLVACKNKISIVTPL